MGGKVLNNITLTLALDYDWSNRQQNARTRILQNFKSKTAMSLILQIINIMKEKKVVFTQYSIRCDKEQMDVFSSLRKHLFV